MMLVFMVLAVILSVALIVLVTIQPRQTQIFSTDATSNIGKPSYWASQPIRKNVDLGYQHSPLYPLTYFYDCFL